MAADSSLRRSFPSGTVVAVIVAAAAMVATLPGRTHGLGLITEPLLAEMHLDRVPFAALNFWATLIGAALCLPAGWAIDRLGERIVLSAVLLGLGAVVVSMAHLTSGESELNLPELDLFRFGGVEQSAVPFSLFMLVLLTRGLGQSALSVVSLSLVGKAAGNRPGPIIGVYSFLVAVGFMCAFGGVMIAIDQYNADWRTVWACIGWVLIGFGVIVFFLLIGQRLTPVATNQEFEPSTRSLTLTAALVTPGFWVFGLGSAFYLLVVAGLSLFNESVLAERGFDRSVFLTITTITPLIGLAANLVAGVLAIRIRLGVLMAGGLLIQAAALFTFPWLTTLTEVYAYAAAMGVAGGVLTVVFFTVWRQAYGPAHLGRIQGAAQLLTVLASAAGPLILAAGQRALGSYAPVMQYLGAVSTAFAVVALVVSLPNAKSNVGAST